MKFIKRKNLQEGEELLYKPLLHWMYIVRHIVLSLPFLVLLLCIWVFINKHVNPFETAWGLVSALAAVYVIRNVILAALLVILLVFVWRIFLYMSCEFGVTNKRLIIKKGIIRLVVAEIPTDRIESIYCVQGLLGRIFRYGTIYISGVGGMIPTFFMVSRPYALRRKIVEVIEKNKAVTVVHGDLPRPAPMPDQSAEADPIYRYGTFVRVIQGHGRQ